MRKKAKYLHDAPVEALRPVLGPNFHSNSASVRPTHAQRHTSHSSETSPNVATFFPQPSPSPFPVYASAQASVVGMPDAIPFGNQQSPVSSNFQGPNNAQLGGLAVPHMSADGPDFAAFFDPNNPALFNFNMDGLSFGSQYGAMEWGILGHMSSGAAETPPARDPSMSQQGAGNASFGPAGPFGNGVGPFDTKVYENNLMGDLLGLDQHQNGLYSQGNLQHGLPHAYAIAAGPQSLQSPSTTETNSPQPTTHGYDASPTTAGFAIASGPPGNKQPAAPPQRNRKSGNPGKLGPHAMLGKRQRDPSYIYDTVKDPFPYVKSFHKLTEVVKARLSSAKTLRIAKSLASIRPSMISCTRTLNRQDLVFMEKSFQRALFEYEEFTHQCSSPTLICRRTGEVAGVNKEFSAVTGWPKQVLLGKEPNLNVNTGAASLTTPGMRNVNTEAGRRALGDGELRPVFLAELLDEDSVIEFYEDFSHLAFNDSRGTVTRTGRLLKYRTQESLNASQPGNPSQESPPKDSKRSILSSRVAKIDGEHGISRLEKDGKLDCTYTWTIKRDTFDIPMMIVMNVSDFPPFLPSLPVRT